VLGLPAEYREEITMSKLDLILGKEGLTCPPGSKQDIKDLMLEIIDDVEEPEFDQDALYALDVLRQKVSKL
jgi:hypothetical protein